MKELTREVMTQLDYSAETVEHRIQIVEKILQGERIQEHINSERYIKNQVKSKKAFLSENSPFEWTLDRMADYILAAKVDEDGNEIESIKSQRDDKKVKRNNREILTNDVAAISDAQLSGDVQSIKLSGYVKPEHKVSTKIPKLNRDYFEKMYRDKGYLADDKEGKHIIPFQNENQVVDYVENATQVIGNYEQAIQLLQKDIEKLKLNNDDTYEKVIRYENRMGKVVTTTLKKNQVIFKLEKQLSSLKNDYELAKLSLVKIVPTNDMSYPAEIDYDDFQVNVDEEGNLYNQHYINFGDKRCINALIKWMPDLYTKYSTEVKSNMWSIIQSFFSLIDKSYEYGYLDFKEKIVAKKLLIIKCPYQAALSLKKFEDRYINLLMRKYGYDENEVITVDMNKDFIREFVLIGGLYYFSEKDIMSKLRKYLHKTYLQSVDEWLYTYKIKGEYKKCSKCGEEKLISNDRYFDKDKTKNDGFKYYCKNCY